METKSNLAILLQPLTPKENFPVDRGSGLEEDAAFKTILDEATRKTQRIQEQASPHQKNESPSVRPDNEQTAASASPPGSTTPDVKNDSEQGPGDGEPVESKATVLDPNADSANGGNRDSMETEVNVAATAKHLMAERLKTLGVDQEKIDAFLRLLAVDENEVSGQETLLQLGAPLNAFQSDSREKYMTAAVAAAADAATHLRAISTSATARDQLAADFLRKAGVDEVQIKNFLQKLSQSQANETGAKATLAEPTHPDAVAENKSRSAFSKAEEFNLSAPASSARETSVSSKTDFQDPLSRALNPNPLRQNAGSEGQAATPLLNLHDAPRGAFILDQGARIIPADFLSQNSLQPAAGNLTVRAEGAPPPAQEVALPKGIPERALMDQIIQKISIHRNGNQSEARIKLTPPSLGTIRMIISTINDTVKATLIVENHAVGQTINNNLTQLKDSIEGQGLKIDQFSVLVGGDAGFDGQNEQRPGAGTFGAPGSEDRSTLETEAQAAPAGTPLLKGMEGNVNIFA